MDLTYTKELLESTGKDIKARRLELGLSQRELGKLAGCSGQNILQVEQDYSRQTTPRIIKLAIILEACKSKEVLRLFKRKELIEKIRELEKKNAALKTFILSEVMGKLSMDDIEDVSRPGLENLLMALMYRHTREFRKKLGLTVSQVGDMMGLSRQTVSKNETRGSPESLMEEFVVLKKYQELKNKEDKV